MPPRAERVALRTRYDRRRAEVVLEAAHVFAKAGYDQTSVPELAEALGIAAGSLYHYFASKEELLIAICDQLMEPLLEQAEAVLAEPEPAIERLSAIVHLWVAHVVAHRDHMLVFQQERHLIETGARWGKVRADRKRFEGLVAELLEQVQSGGEVRIANTRLALSALLGMVNHTSQWHRPGGRIAAGEIADAYLRLLLV